MFVKYQKLKQSQGHMNNPNLLDNLANPVIHLLYVWVQRITFLQQIYVWVFSNCIAHP